MVNVTLIFCVFFVCNYPWALLSLRPRLRATLDDLVIINNVDFRS